MSQPPDPGYTFYTPPVTDQQTVENTAQAQNFNQQAFNYQEYYAQWQQHYAYQNQQQGFQQAWQYPPPAPPAQPAQYQMPPVPTATTTDSYASVVAASAAAYMNTPAATYNRQPPRPTYNAVQMPTFSKEPSQSMKSAAGGEDQWGDDLKSYVAKAFDSIESQEEKDQMERILTQKLEYAFRNKVKIDWSVEPVPIPPTRSLAALRGRGGLNLTRPVSLVSKRGGGRGLPTGMLGSRTPYAQQQLAYQIRNARPAAPPPPPPPPSIKPTKDSDSDMSMNSDEEERPQAPKMVATSPGFRKSAFSQQANKRSSRSRFSSESSDDQDRRTVKKSKATLGRGGIKMRIGSKAADSSPGSPSSPITPEVSGKRNGKKGTRFSGASLQELGSNNRRNQRANRFKEHLESNLTGAGSIAKTTSAIVNSFSRDSDDESGGVLNLMDCKIVGEMRDLEKRYLRLTRAPLPHEVRPVEVLKKSLEHIKRKWADKSDYHFVCEQFKSIRQDLTVQCVEDEFTVKVYEDHADVALQMGDFEEFHQCSSQLMRLHRHGLGAARRLEFTAYRMLYYLFTMDFLGISMILTSLKPAHRENPFIAFAMKVREIWAGSNFVRFFRILEDVDGAPGKCLQVLNWILARERREAAKRIFHAFRPTIDLNYVAKSLAFPTANDCLDFLTKEFSVPAMTFMPRDKIDCKNTWTVICTGGDG